MFNKSILGWGKKDIKVTLKRLAAQQILKFMSVILMHFTDRHELKLLKFQTLYFKEQT